MAGATPLMYSTLGLLSLPKTAGIRDTFYITTLTLCIQGVKGKDDLPLPDRPVMTTISF
jgi:hypothetical protein